MTTFGNWTYSDGVLSYPVHPHFDYHIYLTEITTSGQMLDTIFHIYAKNWGHDAMPGLLEALDRLLHPQANYCSFGASKQADPFALLAISRLVGA